MSCNSVIHDELKNIEEATCLFCDKQLVKVDHSVKVVESCCSEPDIVKKNDNIIVCLNCGSVYGYEYFNFYENMYKIRRKLVYHRKYHIDNVICRICHKTNVQISRDKIDKIEKIFPQIDKRKRMISIKFILRQFFFIYSGLHTKIFK